MTAAIAPLAPRVGTVELGLTATWASMATSPPTKVESQIPQRIHRVLDLRTKGPQEHHVAEDVRPTAMQEHSRQDGDPVMPGSDVRGHRRPLEHECVTTSKFKRKNEEVRGNEAGRNDGKMHRAPGRVG